MGKMGRCVVMLVVFLSGIQVFGQSPAHLKLDSINSQYDEQYPVFNPAFNQLFFTRSGHPESTGGASDQGDIWFSQMKEDSTWSSPQRLSDIINNSGRNGVVGFSRNGYSMYLLNYINSEGSLRGGIAKSTWNGSVWSVPSPLPIRYFSNRSEYIAATISPDEKVMILSIRSYVTEGNEDLYVTFRQGDGSWSQPKNLGKTINTPSEEWSPFLTPDTKYLYFSSNGHQGFGSRDVFVSERLDETWLNWSQPQNLGPSVNTEGVELGYTIPPYSSEAILSSTQNSEGFGDLFRSPLNAEQRSVLPTEPEEEIITISEEQPSMVAMTMRVLDINTEQPVDALLVFTYGAQERTLNTTNITDPNKQFVVSFQEGDNVKVHIEAEGYLTYQETFTVVKQPIDQLTGLNAIEGFRLTPNEVGTSVQIQDVLFKRGLPSFSDSLRAQSALDKLVNLMGANPDLQIRLEGHTDNRGRQDLNKRLSEGRVEAIRRYLVSKGVDRRRIKTVGYGGAKPKASNDTEATRKLNRRVEFVILK